MGENRAKEDIRIANLHYMVSYVFEKAEYWNQGNVRHIFDRNNIYLYFSSVSQIFCVFVILYYSCNTPVVCWSESFRGFFIKF